MIVTITIVDGRTARKLEAMRRVQAAALELFEAHGFEPVTIEQIAQAAGVSVPTVYRGFGSKERIVLWDEYDPLLLEAVTRQVAHGRVLHGVERALGECLDAIYERDRARILRRARLVLRLPKLRNAAAADQAALVEGLAQVLHRAGAQRSLFAARVTGALVAGVLQAAVEEWTRRRGRLPLREVLREAFTHAGALH